MLSFLQVTLHGGEGGQVVTQHVHGVPVVQEVPIPAHRPLPDPLETQLGKFSQTSDQGPSWSWRLIEVRPEYDFPVSFDTISVYFTSCLNVLWHSSDRTISANQNKIFVALYDYDAR